METDHRVIVGDARELDAVGTNSVELVVTSPPYPMIEMWDELFASLDPSIETHLGAEDGDAAFTAMHDTLELVWDEIARVLVEGGIACINVGDATRTLDGRFRVYPNHARVLEAFAERGFDPLPDVLWRKPTNSAAKFMGSGMLPPNAYVTLEHEYILVFRNGDRRTFPAGADRRYEAAYFWEERNDWFSDVWSDVRGEFQTLERAELRERSGAYPFAIPYRLINMYSVYGDTVLDPFWGTGTTTLAAMVAGRESVGCELQREFVDVFEDRVGGVPELSKSVVAQRLADHREFVDVEGPDAFMHRCDQYETPVRTRQETELQFYTVDRVEASPDGYRAIHSPR